MTNMIQEAKNQAAALAMAAYCAAAADGALPKAEVKEAPVEIPRDAGNGDFTTTFALAASKTLRKPPCTPTVLLFVITAKYCHISRFKPALAISSRNI